MTPRPLTPDQVVERGGENAWIVLEARLAPGARVLLGVRPQCVFKPTRLVTPVGPVRFVVGDIMHNAGDEVLLAESGIDYARVGALLVFEVWNESEHEESLDVRVYGIALDRTGEIPVGKPVEGPAPRGRK